MPQETEDAKNNLTESLEEPFAQITEKLGGWIEAFIAMLPNMAVAVLLFILFLFLAKTAKNLFVKLFKKSTNHDTLQSLFGNLIYYLVIGIGLFIVLGILKLDKAVTSLLAGVGVVGLALGFAFQDIAANFVSGVILAFRSPFHQGNVVKVGDYMGTVSRTNLRVTVLRTFQGQEVYIPNKDVLQNPIENFSKLGERRIDLGVGVSYGDNLDKVEDLVRKTINALEGVIDPDRIVFHYNEYGGSSINFEIKFWIKFVKQPDYLTMRSKAIKAIKVAFDENDITIPFPIRTLDFGIKGGERLSEMALNLHQQNGSADNNPG